MNWEPILRPAEQAENRLLEAILTGHFPINSTLPGERELAESIGVTRPTLREALQRLARDGWLDIQQGKATRVRDYWREGSLAVLTGLAESPSHQSPDFVVHMLQLRVLIAPFYARVAVASAPGQVKELLDKYTHLGDDPQEFVHADWELHSLMALNAQNPVFLLLLNGFKRLYFLVGRQYFTHPECREHSRGYYTKLLDCARRGDAPGAEILTRKIMEESLELATRLQEEDR